MADGVPFRSSMLDALRLNTLLYTHLASTTSPALDTIFRLLRTSISPDTSDETTLLRDSQWRRVATICVIVSALGLVPLMSSRPTPGEAAHGILSSKRSILHNVMIAASCFRLVRNTVGSDDQISQSAGELTSRKLFHRANIAFDCLDLILWLAWLKYGNANGANSMNEANALNDSRQSPIYGALGLFFITQQLQQLYADAVQSINWRALYFVAAQITLRIWLAMRRVIRNIRQVMFQKFRRTPITDEVPVVSTDSAVAARLNLNNLGTPSHPSTHICPACGLQITNATPATCGHVYCYVCLYTAVMAGKRWNVPPLCLAQTNGRGICGFELNMNT